MVDNTQIVKDTEYYLRQFWDASPLPEWVNINLPPQRYKKKRQIKKAIKKVLGEK